MAQLKPLLSLYVAILILLTPIPAQAQWPPFNFYLTPTYADGKITYTIWLSNLVDWPLEDVAIKIRPPEGTRFVSAASLRQDTTFNFDGQEVTFFTSVAHRSIGDISFKVEVVDPQPTVFTTHAWISWKGEQPGTYLSEDEPIDISRQPLNWQRPAPPLLRLTVGATIADDIITYTLFPENTGRLRMWDVKISIPIPSGAQLLSANAPPPYVTNFNDTEVSFSIIELEKKPAVEPLTLKISTAGMTNPLVITQAWANWKNSGPEVGQAIPPAEQYATGQIMVQPHTRQQVLADFIGDVPFANYDLQSVALQDDGANLKINFYPAGDLGPVGGPLDFLFYIDNDCLTETGYQRYNRGAEYQVRYDHRNGRATLVTWDATQADWLWDQLTDLNWSISDKAVSIWMPLAFIESQNEFCWTAISRDISGIFSPSPPVDVVPSGQDLRLTRYQLLKSPPANAVNLSSASPFTITTTSQPVTATAALTSTLPAEYIIPPGAIWHYVKGYGPASANLAAWPQVGFTETGWLTGTTPMGYGESNLATTLTDMKDNYLTILMRYTFNLPDPAEVSDLFLDVAYDDGFIAYLNGIEVARRNLGLPDIPTAYNQPATLSHEATNTETINLSSVIAYLEPGPNVLAIQAHNRQLSSVDFVINPALRRQKVEPADPNDAPLPSQPLPQAFINLGDSWQYLPGRQEPLFTWKTVDFDDSDWLSGPTGLGYVNRNPGQVTLATNLFEQNNPLPASVFMRRIFTVNQPDQLTQLALEVDYEGGFVAYLNGVEVARRGLGPSGQPIFYNTWAAPHPAGISEVIDLSRHIASLVTGQNVLAIRIHSALDKDGPTLYMAPKLTWK
jgi:hypothetical protein